MREERDIERSASSSSITPILIAVAALTGLSLLVCGGAAGYVALTTPARVEVEDASAGLDAHPQPTLAELPERERLRKMEQTRANIPITNDAATINRIAASMFVIDLPAGFEPIEATKNPFTGRAVFGKTSRRFSAIENGRIGLASYRDGIIGS